MIKLVEKKPLYKNNIRLNNPRAVQRLLARVINALNKYEISVDRAKAMGYLADKMFKAFEVADLEERIKELERVANERK